jgi:hypothetical protein
MLIIYFYLLFFRKQELMISDLTSTIREQDHALTTLTQEKRALQLQLSRIGNAREHNSSSPVKGLERISECTEPSRDSRESSVSRSDNVFSSCSSENYRETLDSHTELYESQIRHTDSPIDHLDSQVEQFDCQIRHPDSPIDQFNSQMGQIENQIRQFGNELEIIESEIECNQIEQARAAGSSNTQLQLHFSQLGPYDSFDDQMEPLIEEPDSPEIEEDINLSDCDRNSDNFEDFDDTMLTAVAHNNNLTVPFDSERSTYLSISPARSDATNCISIPSTPSPERSITFSKNSSNPEISEEYSNNELQIPRTYFLSHSPDSIFPREKCFLSRSKSLGTKLQKMHLFSRASSSPL